MASVESGSAADTAQIWGGQERGCSGKVTKRHLVAVGALAGCAVLGLGLFVGLSDNSSNDSGGGSQIVGQALQDSNSKGCYVDVRSDRVMENVLTDEGMTPAVSKALYHAYIYDGGCVGTTIRFAGTYVVARCLLSWFASLPVAGCVSSSKIKLI